MIKVLTASPARENDTLAENRAAEAMRAACIAALEANRDRYAALAADSDEDSLVGRMYRDYLAAHIADIAALREVKP